MHHQRQPAVVSYGAAKNQEGSLIDVEFLGSFPSADFTVTPPLPEIAFFGRSNVGKSSLINAVVGRKAIAHTSKKPGKTKMCNVYRIDERFCLVDFPGYGFAQVSKSERKQFELLYRDYLQNRKELVGVVWLLDVRHPPSTDDKDMAVRLTAAGVPTLIAITKADKVKRGARPQHVKTIRESLALSEDQCILTSTLNKEGIDELRESLDALLDA